MGLDEEIDYAMFHTLKRCFVIRFKEEEEEKCDLVAAKLEEGVFWKDSGRVIYGWRSDGRERMIKIKMCHQRWVVKLSGKWLRSGERCWM